MNKIQIIALTETIAYTEIVEVMQNKIVRYFGEKNATKDPHWPCVYIRQDVTSIDIDELLQNASEALELHVVLNCDSKQTQGRFTTLITNE